MAKADLEFCKIKSKESIYICCVSQKICCKTPKQLCEAEFWTIHRNHSNVPRKKKYCINQIWRKFNWVQLRFWFSMHIFLSFFKLAPLCGIKSETNVWKLKTRLDDFYHKSLQLFVFNHNFIHKFLRIPVLRNLFAIGFLPVKRASKTMIRSFIQSLKMFVRRCFIVRYQ